MFVQVISSVPNCILSDWLLCHRHLINNKTQRCLASIGNPPFQSAGDYATFSAGSLCKNTEACSQSRPTHLHLHSIIRDWTELIFTTDLTTWMQLSFKMSTWKKKPTFYVSYFLGQLHICLSCLIINTLMVRLVTFYIYGIAAWSSVCHWELVFKDKKKSCEIVCSLKRDVRIFHQWRLIRQ